MSQTLDATLAADRPAPPPGPVTFEEFLAWAPESALAEWDDGEVLVMAPANIEHQRGFGFLFRLLALFVEARGLGEVLAAPFIMRLPTRPSGREMVMSISVATCRMGDLPGMWGSVAIAFEGDAAPLYRARREAASADTPTGSA